MYCHFSYSKLGCKTAPPIMVNYKIYRMKTLFEYLFVFSRSIEEAFIQRHAKTIHTKDDRE